MGTRPTSRLASLALTAAIVELTLTTAYIHLTLGGVLFTLNAAGYFALALAVTVGAARPHPLVDRFSWLPRIALAGFTLVTIGAYLVIGPYFSLGWIAKGIEVAILTLLAADVVRVYESPMGLIRAALASLPGSSRMRPVSVRRTNPPSNDARGLAANRRRPPTRHRPSEPGLPR
ncbi:MAG: hypothetical protein M3R49_08885 [Chloroflexota bacterium]|nr:hypothetical protein [Chloroflexota bacterium]